MKSIILRTEEARRLQEAGKVQIRRVVKPQPPLSEWGITKPWKTSSFAVGKPLGNDHREYKCPYQPGDVLWVKEKFSYHDRIDDPYYLAPSYPEQVMGVWYWADGEPDYGNWNKPRSSVHMPRWASRADVVVKDVRVERVQEISEEDAKAEGMPGGDDFPLENKSWCPTCHGQGVHGALGEHMGWTEVDCGDCNTSKKLFRNLWESINAKRGYSWESNPWVWVVEFEVMQ